MLVPRGISAEGLLRAAAHVRRGDLTRWAEGKTRRITEVDGERIATWGMAGGRHGALVTDMLDFHRRRRDNLAALLDTLRPVPVAVAPVQQGEPIRLAARESERDVVVARLRALLPYWNPTWTDRPHGSVTLNPAYVPQTSSTTVLHPNDLMVTVEFLEREGDDLVSEYHSWFERLPAEGWEDYAAESADAALTGGFATVLGPIDIVYTWVDGSDPAWRARKDAALRRVSDERPDVRRHPSASDPARFADSDELRYSLRSVAQFAGWVGDIHIVTDGQVPAWLDTSHPRIHVVDHSEILPGPVFNSHAIESALHRIPGLSERYLYLNDDVFFGRIAYPGDYFHDNGIAKFFPSDLPITPGPPLPDDLPIMAAAKNGRDLIARRFGREVTTKIRHTVHPQIRGVVEQMERENPDLFSAMAHSLFRSGTDVSVAASLHHWYAYYQGKAAPAETNYLYLDISQPGSGQMLDALASLRRYDTFCLNQEVSADNSAEARERLKRFLARYFPWRAPWERPTTA